MSEPITIGIKTMELSDNRKEHWVFVRRGDREITPHNYSGPYLNRAEYEVAEWKHVLLGWPKPDLMDPKYADPQAPTVTTDATATTHCNAYHVCPNMKEVGGGMDGERYSCAVCGKGYYLDYEEMK
ncbi:hypothetical protein NKJ71_13560 [Mesorhizobium sp. M0050]|uniref:hypothetical protein n=1 Tax=Mesorhizobium sp. M0050 TaxID=2956861 RepID=UPI0033389D60